MGKTINRKQRTVLLALFLIMSLAGAGCGESGQPESPARSSQGEGTQRPDAAPKMGTLSSGYFYEQDGIAVSSKERFLYSDWEPVEFDYICTDPICSHQTQSCSARSIQDEKSVSKDFSLIYQDRLIILHAYSILEINQSSETIQEWSTVYQTDVYEADPDGSNRRKMVTFSGAIASPVITYTAVLIDGKLYFGGAMEVRDRIEQDGQGGGSAAESRISDAIYCLDLNDYTVETFAVTKDREGLGYQYQFYEYDGMIYAIISSFQEDSAVWYRIDPGMGVCEEILRFDSNVARFAGAIGDTVYYKYENSEKTLYARNLATGEKEREFRTVTGDDMSVSSFVLDGQILFMSDSCIEGEERMAEYAVLDPEGKVVDTIRYDDYITFLDVVGEKIIYFKLDSEWEVWWADKGDLKNLSEKGVRIGPYFGQSLDVLGN